MCYIIWQYSNRNPILFYKRVDIKNFKLEGNDEMDDRQMIENFRSV